MQSGDGDVVGDERRSLVLESLGEHPGDSGLHVVGPSVEALADVQHQPGGEVAEGPVIVNLVKRAV